MEDIYFENINEANTNTISTPLRARFSKYFNRIPKEVYSNENIEKKLSIFFLPNLDGTEYVKNYIYKLLLNFDDKVTYEKHDINVNESDIDTIKWIISNLDTIRKEKEIMFTIAIKKEKKIINIYVYLCRN